MIPPDAAHPFDCRTILEYRDAIPAPNKTAEVRSDSPRRQPACLSAREQSLGIITPHRLASGNEWDKTFPKSDKVDHRKVTLPILQYSGEIRSAVLVMHGEKAHK